MIIDPMIALLIMIVGTPPRVVYARMCLIVGSLMKLSLLIRGVSARHVEHHPRGNKHSSLASHAIRVANSSGSTNRFMGILESM